MHVALLIQSARRHLLLQKKALQRAAATSFGLKQWRTQRVGLGSLHAARFKCIMDVVLPGCSHLKNTQTQTLTKKNRSLLTEPKQKLEIDHSC